MVLSRHAQDSNEEQGPPPQKQRVPPLLEQAAHPQEHAIAPPLLLNTRPASTTLPRTAAASSKRVSMPSFALPPVIALAAASSTPPVATQPPIQRRAVPTKRQRDRSEAADIAPSAEEHTKDISENEGPQQKRQKRDAIPKATTINNDLHGHGSEPVAQDEMGETSGGTGASSVKGRKGAGGGKGRAGGTGRKGRKGGRGTGDTGNVAAMVKDPQVLEQPAESDPQRRKLRTRIPKASEPAITTKPTKTTKPGK